MELQDILNSEYGIAGLGDLGASAIAQRLVQNPVLAKQLVTAAVSKNTVSSRGSRAEMESRFGQLEAKIRTGLLNGTLQCAETAFYFVKQASGLSNIHMIQSGDKRTPGICNLDGGKIEITQPFLLSGVMLLSGVGAGIAEADGKACDFGLIDKYLRNGDFEFKANGDKTLIPRMSTEVFVTHRIARESVDIDGAGSGTTVAPTAVAWGENAKVGLYKLDNPKLIMSQNMMNFDLEWGTPLATNTWLKVVLLGTRVYAH